MQTVFLELVKLSLIGSLFAAAVMVVRLVFRRAPKWLFCVLWGVVALRLICPLSIESNVSLIPERLASGQIITNVGNEYIGDVDILYESNAGYINAVEAGRKPIFAEDGYYVITEKDSLEAPRTVGETVYPILSWIWATGMMLMLAYTALSYLLLRRKMEEATRLRDNIWQCEQVDSPFVLGFLKPRIYLPYAITDSDMANVIAHEQAHIRRRDHWWKPVGFLLLSIHWFNPVLWLAYILLCRDIEAACDEKVIRHMEKDEMRAYSAALLHCSVHRRRIAACPLAFGETGVKERIKRVMNYKKPAFWVIISAAVVCIAVAICFLTNPSSGDNWNITEDGYYLQIGADGVKSIEVSGPNSSGGVSNADGTAFRKGEKVWLEQLQGITDLSGYSIIALGDNGEVVYMLSLPEGTADGDWSLIKTANPEPATEYKVTTYLTATEQMKVIEAYNQIGKGITVTVKFDTSEGPRQIELVCQYKKAAAKEWTQQDPASIYLGETAAFTVPADHHFIIMAKSLGDHRGNVTFAMEEAPDTDESDQNAETTPDETGKQEPPLTIASKGEAISPYLHRAYSGFWDGKGFLCADGIPVGAVLPQLESEGCIPHGEYSRDFHVLLGDNVQITHILLFDEKFDPLDTVWDIEELSKLETGNYYVGIVVSKEGEYIQEVDRNEYTGWVCVVRLFVNSEESTAAGSTGINLSYCGNKDNSIMIEDAATCSKLMAFIEKAGGEQGASTKGCYGAVYTLTVSLEGEKEPLRFSLWNDGTYSTSRHTDSEGYDYFFNGDVSDLYQYLEENYPTEFWYPDMTDPAFDITVAYANYADWENLEEFYARALNRDTFTQSSVRHLPIYQLDTQADLAEFKGAVDGILSVDQSYDEIPSFNTATAKYDEAFFEENSLMVTYVTASSGSCRFGVDSVAFDNGRFCVHVKQTNYPEIFTQDMAGWFITVAIPDQMAKACYTFDAQLDKIQNRKEVPGAGVHVVDIWDRTITEQIGCDTALEKFWEDEANEYYFGCIKSRYIMVMDSTGRIVDVVKALEEGLITIETLDYYGIVYAKEPKT